MEENNYDSIAVAAEFVGTCPVNRDLAAHWTTWTPNHAELLREYRGTNCVGLALLALPLFEGFGGELISSTKNQVPHIAVKVPFASSGTNPFSALFLCTRSSSNLTILSR